MAGLKEIRSRIKSVTNTKKITYAMKLVSATKLKKAQDAVQSSRAYSEKLNSLLSGVLSQKDTNNLNHALCEKPSEVRKIKILVIGANRGLCGSYNTGVNNKVQEVINEKKSEYPNAEIDACLLGRKPIEFFNRIEQPFSKGLSELSEDANEWPIDDISAEIEDQFISKEIDELILIYTKFKSALTIIPTSIKLLPLEQEEEEASESANITKFEPSPKEFFQTLIPKILRSKIRQATLDSKASEYGSRMTAMDSATKNAGDLIKALTRKSNKLRQSSITGEILDIVGGAEATK